MKYTRTSVNLAPEILKRKLGAELLVPVTIASTAFSNGIVKAGTPITASGEKAITSASSNNADGILLYDVTDDNPNGSMIKAFADVNVAVAENHSGVSYDTYLKSKLNLIVFE